MDVFSWQGFLFAPLALSNKLQIKIVESGLWSDWRERFSSSEESRIFEDIRRFLISPIRDKFFPLCEKSGFGRKTLDVDRLSKSMPWFPLGGGVKASVIWIDLLMLERFSLLVIKLDAGHDLTEDNLYTVNRKIPAWFSRYPSDDVAYWKTDEIEKITLRNWVEKYLLGLTSFESLEVFGNTDWFGHSLPMASFVGVSNVNRLNIDDNFVNLLVGAPYDNDSYALCETEIKNIINRNTFQIYNNWLLGNHNNRMIFYGIRNERSPILINLEKHYIYIAALVFYQKIMLTNYLEEFLRIDSPQNSSHSKNIRKCMITFKKNYFPDKISTYPLGERIYQFFLDVENIRTLSDRLTLEVEATDDYERLVLERRENSLLNFIAISASLTLPITTVGTIYGVKDEYLSDITSGFWLWSGLLTGVFLLILLSFKFIIGKKDEKKRVF